MRQIKYIVNHHTGGWLHQSVASIQAHWRSLGWRVDGYHHLIDQYGKDHNLVPIERIANGVDGYNKDSIHIACIGGLVSLNPVKYADMRTPQQKETQVRLNQRYKAMFPNAVVLGHRDFSTDLNGNGKIDQWEYIKFCPGYDAREWFANIGKEELTIPAKIVYKLNYPLVKNSFVGEIQRQLNIVGAGLKVDNVFGKKTHEAVTKFQRENGELPTGIVDHKTAWLLGIEHLMLTV